MGRHSAVTGEQPPVYLVHGLLGTAYGHFGRQIAAWQDRYRPVPVDLPGHGTCPLDAEPDYLDGALAYLTAVMDRFGPGHLVAASYLGGPLAVRCAESRPGLVVSLALTGFAPGPDRAAFLGLVAGFHRLADEQPALAAEYDRLHTARWRKTLTAFTEHVERAYERTVRIDPARLGALGVPVLVANGSLKSAERETAERAAGFGPAVRGLVLEGAGHIASHDAPGPFTAAVEELWREARHGRGARHRAGAGPGPGAQNRGPGTQDGTAGT
jgi:pimeloyl-ACP methyl ester carboxylesterase